MNEEGVSRRDLLKWLTAFSASTVTGISSLALLPNVAEAARALPRNVEKKTLKAFADTIIPGSKSDPEGSAGGVEARALQVLYDPYYGLRPFIGILTRNLNRASLFWYRRPFKDLDLNERTKLVLLKDYCSLIKPVYEQAEILVKLAFYGAIINTVGTDYISFPGPSFGYYDYSFNQKLAEEATEDGNLP